MTKSADPKIVAEIRRLALDPTRVQTTKQATLDMLGQHLTIDDVCDKIIEWIDAGERVKPTSIHTFPGLQGQPAYEMKPRINSILFYVKVALVERGNPGERMLLISAHPDH
ncbi:MAG: hypothetical protein ABR915_11475 [Thermoguttaceae bacterium]|jgi:hypothetical protein